jgi:hypothetical protein
MNSEILMQEVISILKNTHISVDFDKIEERVHNTFASHTTLLLM